MGVDQSAEIIFSRHSVTQNLHMDLGGGEDPEFRTGTFTCVR